MTSETDDFQTLLAEAGIEFTPPPGFDPCPVHENSVFAYQYAHRSPSGDLELRYRIDSIKRLEEERRIANEGMEVLASTDLNNLHEYSFMATLFNLSGGMLAEPSVFKPETSALLYNADWCALGFIRLADNDFAPGYDSAYVLAIHKSGVADIYVIGLYNDISGEPEHFDKNSLPPVVKINLAPALRFT
ncbi:MAG: hypothetical protein A3K04_11225 [Gallionellales bacterium RBG_16_56_9]|nr:MAG: hypothetical protein A3K04_11225 [Gallionellales bacterium RBG_16_56_9]